jgi:glycine/D-amino acid oxidase-like deaminating enzyme
MPADVAVIGAGSFGAWTALQLRRAGLSVILIDAWGPAHSHASSGGESRIIRMGYGADEIYTRMAQRSLIAWQELFAETRQPLFHRTGVLWIGRHGDAYSEATSRTLSGAGVPFEILSAAEIAARYPQMRITDERAFGIFEPGSGALMARRAVAAVADAAMAADVEYHCAAIQPPVRSIDVLRISAGTFVFACGAWLPKLFPNILGRRIFPTRQEVLFFAPPPGDPRFSPPRLPIWLDFTDPRGPYGFPDLESGGVKFAFDRHGPPFDPDSGDRTVGAASIAEARAFLAQRFPDLRDAPLTETRVCQYENTSNGDFLIDRHPDLANVWLVGGGSGHGFKHGPAVAEHVVSRIVHGAPGEPRFSLASKAEEQRRAVW